MATMRKMMTTRTPPSVNWPYWYIVMCSRSWILLEHFGQHKPIRGLVKPRYKATAGWLNTTRKMLHHPGASLIE